jgi:hypothetical protein
MMMIIEGEIRNSMNESGMTEAQTVHLLSLGLLLWLWMGGSIGRTGAGVLWLRGGLSLLLGTATGRTYIGSSTTRFRAN